MPNEKQGVQLTESEIKEIKDKAAAQLGICKKCDDVIGTQVFSILSLYSRVIYYPLGENAPWGFTRMNGSTIKNEVQKPFVAINTDIPVDNQVFAAAHELYHIWYESSEDIVPSTILDDVQERNEIKANRFAAEFLVDEDLLKKEMQLYSIISGKITLKDILKLADLFTVPYRAMVKRLFEIDAINKKIRDDYLQYSDAFIVTQRKRYSFVEPIADHRIVMDNLVDLAVTAYEKHEISLERLAYLLSLSKMRPSDVGVYDDRTSYLPSDDELDAIMEES